MRLKCLRWCTLASVVALSCGTAWSQSGNGLDNPDWVEEPVPPPPAFVSERQIGISMPPHVSVKVGVDPDTIAVGMDGVVRYVAIMTNANGNTNAVYEGIRCISDEVKTYARLNAAGQWNMVKEPVWKGLGENMPSRHAFAVARQGACQNRLATSPQEIIAALKSPTRGPGSIKDY
jgi:hypothetical protein